MFAIKKWVLPELDLNAEDKEINKQVFSIVYLDSPNFVLSYDTEDLLVYHTILEIELNLIEKHKDIVENFYQEYSKTEELNDCADLIGDICAQLMKSLNSNANKYFFSFQEIVEEILVCNFKYQK